MLPAPTRMPGGLRSLAGHELRLGVGRIGRHTVLNAVVRIERGIVLRLEGGDTGTRRVVPDLGRELEELRVRLPREAVEGHGEAGAADGWRVGHRRSNQPLPLERNELSDEFVVV